MKVRGFTLIELLVVLAIVGIIWVVFAGGTGIFAGGVEAKADSEMRSYIAKLYPGQAVQGIVCSNRDSDNDGYVRCSATLVAVGGAQSGVIEAECSAPIYMTWQKGCVPLRAIARNRK